MSPSVRSTSDDGRYSLIATGCAGLVERAVDDREAAAADLAIDAVIQERVTAGECLVVDGHRGCGEAANARESICPQIACQGCPFALRGERRTHTLSPMRASKAKPRSTIAPAYASSTTANLPSIPDDSQHDRLRVRQHGAAGHFACSRAPLGQSPLPRRHHQAARGAAHDGAGAARAPRGGAEAGQGRVPGVAGADGGRRRHPRDQCGPRRAARRRRGAPLRGRSRYAAADRPPTSSAGRASSSTRRFPRKR